MAGTLRRAPAAQRYDDPGPVFVSLFGNHSMDAVIIVSIPEAKGLGRREVTVSPLRDRQCFWLVTIVAASLWLVFQ